MENLIQTINSLSNFDLNTPLNFNLPASFLTASAEETFFLGFQIANLLEKGGIAALNGVLGAGKTVLAKGIGKGLGVKEEITSPTYTIVSEYEGVLSHSGPVSVYHIDAYRLDGNGDFSAMGGEEIVFGKGISLIEWGEKIPSFITGEALKIDIEITKDEKRFIRVYKANNPPGQEGEK